MMYHEEPDHNIIWRDLLFNTALAFLAVMFLLIPLINDPGEKDNRDGDVKFTGAVMVEIHWPDDYQSDVDLWVKSPGDSVPVGYSNKGSTYFNLLRDDLGAGSDTMQQNTEIAVSRGIAFGEYIVNVHLFDFGPGNGGGFISKKPDYQYPDVLPFEVAVRAYLVNAYHARVDLVETHVTLRKDGEEVTAFRFTLRNNNGTPAMVPGSVNSIPKELRAFKSEID